MGFSFSHKISDCRICNQYFKCHTACFFVNSFKKDLCNNSPEPIGKSRTNLCLFVRRKNFDSPVHGFGCTRCMECTENKMPGRCSFYGKGAGKVLLKCYEYSSTTTRCPANHGIIQTFELGPEWKQYESVYEPSDKSDTGFCFVLSVLPGAEATVDDIDFWRE